jgi:hypothetical protein
MTEQPSPSAKRHDTCLALRDWLRVEEVAELLGVTTDLLLIWRVGGRGAAFLVWNMNT